MVADLILYGVSKGLDLAIREVWRAPELQQIYKKTGKSWTLRSKHLRALAVDFNLYIDGKHISSGTHPAWKDLAEYWTEMLHGRHLGTRDANHFEFP